MTDVFKFFKLKNNVRNKINFNLKNLNTSFIIIIGYDYNDGKKKTLKQFALGSLNFYMIS